VPGTKERLESVTSDPTAITHHTAIRVVGMAMSGTDEVTRTMGLL
jgi:hypothetical protein